MNKFYHVLFFFLLMLPLTSRADIERTLNLHYEESDFTIQKNGDLVRITPSIPLSLYGCIDYNTPCLPLLVYDLPNVDSKKEYEVSLTITSSEKIIVEKQVNIATILPLDSDNRLIIDEWIKYNFKNYHPKEKVELRINNGLASFWVSPFEYDYKTGNLYFTKDLNIHASIKEKLYKKELRDILQVNN